MNKLRRYFITGLILVLPAVITFYLLFGIFFFIDNLCGRFVNAYLRREFGFFIPGLGVILGLISVTAVGFLTSHYLSRRALTGLEKWLLHFPFIRQIYPSVKQIVNFFIKKEKTPFKKVALVEYPCKGIWSLGFVTGEGFKEAEDKTGKKLVHIFIATTPSPFSGFFVLIPLDEVRFLDLSVEDGLKLIVSGGIAGPAEQGI
jgi:uncharacterized membrane protein